MLSPNCNMNQLLNRTTVLLPQQARMRAAIAHTVAHCCCVVCCAFVPLAAFTSLGTESMALALLFC